MADRRLNGFNPLSYLGTNPYTPPDTVIHPRDPVSTDSQNFELGTFWLNTVNESLWVLVNLNQNIATWVELSIGSTGTIDKLHTSDGNDVTPTAGRINLANGDNITTTGTNGPNTVTISVSGTTNHSLQLGNAAGSLTSLGVATNGQLPIGSTGADPVLATLTAGSGISISNAAGSITIATSGTMATDYHTDSGDAAPAANILNVLGGTAGRDINTSGSGNTIHIDLNNAITLGDLSSIIGSPALTATTGDVTLSAGNINLPDAHVTGGAFDEGTININGSRFINAYGALNQNTFVGKNSGTPTLTPLSATNNTGIGSLALSALTTGGNNTTLGHGAGNAITTGGNNVLIGEATGAQFVSGTGNVITGCLASTGDAGATGLISGSWNVLIGGGDNSVVFSAGSQYTGAESSNILIRNTGVTGENNKIRIGASGSGAGQQNACFIGGISGVNVGSVATVVTNSGDQLGTATITAGTGVTITPGANTITISASGTMNLTYTAVSTTPYVVLTTDQFLGVNSSGGIRTIQLPNAPATGRVFTIKDSTGSAATNNITVTTVGGAVNIDGATSFVMNTAYESINVLFDGSTYQVY